MNQRVNPFAGLDNPPAFTTKQKKDTSVPEETITRIAAENNFPSRQPPKPSAPQRKPRRYRTGRNQQQNIKATGETIEKLIRMADERKVPLGELLRLALDALDRAGA
jgi:hypothetical protein